MRVARVVLLLLAAVVFEAQPVWAVYDSKGKRDPLIPLINSEGQRIHPPGFDEEVLTGIQGLNLQGIVFDPQAESYAIINGQVVRDQDEIEGMKVLQIDPGAVTILANGQEHRVQIQDQAAEEEGLPPTKETDSP